MSLEDAFKKFASKNTEGVSRDINKWFTDAKVFSKPSCSSNSLDISFSKYMDKKKKTVNFAQFEKILEEMSKSYAKDKKMEPEAALAAMKEKLSKSEKQSHGTTKASNKGVTGRMTDTSKYTGAHKERFDESGKGKGIKGREEVVENSGYVGNYKGDGTYDKEEKE